LQSGAGLDRFRRLVEAQGGDPHVVEDTSLLAMAPVVREFRAPQDGWLATVDTAAIGRTSGALGAGRETIGAVIDPAVGLALDAKIGDRLRRSETIGRIFARTDDSARAGEFAVLDALGWSSRPVDAPPLIHEVIEHAQI
jgi:thymidine phosphorylase